MMENMRLVTAALAALLPVAVFGQGNADPWKPADLIQPKDVAARLAQKPVLFHVGFATLYRSKHIPGTVYLGPGAREEGLAALRKAAAAFPRDREIILYCGCCPWNECPNMRPAFSALRAMGFTRVKAMYTPTNLVKDWIEKGYPVEGATAP